MGESLDISDLVKIDLRNDKLQSFDAKVGRKDHREEKVSPWRDFGESLPKSVRKV